jgi:hypothetical protein
MRVGAAVILVIEAICLVLFGIAMMVTFDRPASPGFTVGASSLIWAAICLLAARIFWKSRKLAGLRGGPPSYFLMAFLWLPNALIVLVIVLASVDSGPLALIRFTLGMMLTLPFVASSIVALLATREQKPTTEIHTIRLW